MKNYLSNWKLSTIPAQLMRPIDKEFPLSCPAAHCDEEKE